MIRLEEEKRKEQIKKLDEVSNRFDSIIRNVTEEDRMRAADTMARVKEIENREKKKNALNKMLKAINGISNERLSNEELSRVFSVLDKPLNSCDTKYVSSSVKSNILNSVKQLKK